MDNRHAFQILEQLGPEADRLGIKVVDAYGQSGPVTEFLSKIIRYIEAREAEIDRLRITPEERAAIEGLMMGGCEPPEGVLNAEIDAVRGLLARHA